MNREYFDANPWRDIFPNEARLRCEAIEVGTGRVGGSGLFQIGELRGSGFPLGGGLLEKINGCAQLAV